MDKSDTKKATTSKMNMRGVKGNAKKNIFESIENDAEKMAMVMQLVCW